MIIALTTALRRPVLIGYDVALELLENLYAWRSAKAAGDLRSIRNKDYVP